MTSETGSEIGTEGGAGSTRKLYVAISLPGSHGSGPMQAVAVIMYVPGPTLATGKESVITPSVIVQLLGILTGMPDNEQTASLENPELDATEIDVPGRAIERLNVIC